ncbi:MAG: hypothetical protein OXN94_08670 [Chloroflexota bacterium]|nr:hypothetical protein [Chloroflexota bacterium]
MPNDEGFDRRNMRYIDSPPWMRRALRGLNPSIRHAVHLPA